MDDGKAAEEYPVTFIHPYQPGYGITGDAIREWGQGILDDKQTPDNQIVAALGTIYDSFFKSFHYSEIEQEHITRELIDNIRNTSPRETLDIVLKVLLPVKERQMRVEDMKREKDKILAQLQVDNADNATIIAWRRDVDEDRKVEGFIIKKD